MTKATSTKQITKAIRNAGFAVDCVKGNGYVYFIADDMYVEIDSVYVCYLNQLSVEHYVEHVAGYLPTVR
jgi:hypothetical protein